MLNQDSEKKSVCVFCSSSDEVSLAKKRSAAELGTLLARDGYRLIYGGTSSGLMKEVALAHKSAGGYVIGVIPDFMMNCNINISEMDLVMKVPDMHARKKTMLDRSDAFIVLPGGIGTFDEFFDLLAQKQLKRHCKPMYLLNCEKYFEPLLALFRWSIETGTVRNEHMGLFDTADEPQEIMRLLNYELRQ